MKTNIFFKSILFVVVVCSITAYDLSAEGTSSIDEKVSQLQKENETIKKDNTELSAKAEKLEKENNELKDLLKQQDGILTALAKTKIFTKKAWDTLVSTVKDLNTKVDKKVKELEQKEKK